MESRNGVSMHKPTKDRINRAITRRYNQGHDKHSAAFHLRYPSGIMKAVGDTINKGIPGYREARANNLSNSGRNDIEISHKLEDWKNKQKFKKITGKRIIDEMKILTPSGWKVLNEANDKKKKPKPKPKNDSDASGEYVGDSDQLWSQLKSLESKKRYQAHVADAHGDKERAERFKKVADSIKAKLKDI